MPLSTTRISGGTVISMPPRTVVARSTISLPGSTASRKSSSAPPKTVTTSMTGSACQTPFLVAPLKIATIRPPRLVGEQWDELRVGLGRVDGVQSLRVLVGGQPALGQRVVDHRCRRIAIGVGGPQAGILVEAVGVHVVIVCHSSGRRNTDGEGRDRMGHVEAAHVSHVLPDGRE